MAWRKVVVAIVVGGLAACAPRSTPRPAEPEQPLAQPPRPQQAPAPPIADTAWEEAPLTPGDWSYSGDGDNASASYGESGRPALAVRCEPGRRVSLTRMGASGGGAIVIRTTSGARSVAAAPQQGGLAAILPASDALLDDIVFSRGRFSVEAAGAAMLVIPTWAEFARVVEDCRA